MRNVHWKENHFDSLNGDRVGETSGQQRTNPAFGNPFFNQFDAKNVSPRLFILLSRNSHTFVTSTH